MKSKSFEKRFETAPGHQTQVDFARFTTHFRSEPDIERVVWLFLMVLGYSRFMVGQFAWRQTLDTFDFSFQPTLDKQRVMTLAELGFVERQQAIHLLGPPGVGKTHLAIALGILAVKAGYAVYFTTLSDLIASLTKAERETIWRPDCAT